MIVGALVSGDQDCAGMWQEECSISSNSIHDVSRGGAFLGRPARTGFNSCVLLAMLTG